MNRLQDLRLILYGTDGKTGELTLKNQLGLKIASSRDFNLENVKNVGIIKEIGISLANSGASRPGRDRYHLITLFTGIIYIHKEAVVCC